MILNLKKNYCHKSQFFKDVDIEKVVIFKKISSGGKNCKYFIGYLYNDFKVKLPKTSPYVKNYDEQTKCMYFFIEDDYVLEKYDTICIRSVLISKKNLIASLFIIKKNLKPK